MVVNEAAGGGAGAAAVVDAMLLCLPVHLPRARALMHLPRARALMPNGP